jgi:hypothetical protein
MLFVCPLRPFPPRLKLTQKFGRTDPVVISGGFFQLEGTLLEEGLETRQIAAREMVKGRGHLNQAVEKRLLFARGLQPEGFQGFVRLEEFPRIE